MTDRNPPRRKACGLCSVRKVQCKRPNGDESQPCFACTKKGVTCADMITPNEKSPKGQVKILSASTLSRHSSAFSLLSTHLTHSLSYHCIKQYHSKVPHSCLQGLFSTLSCFLTAYPGGTHDLEGTAADAIAGVQICLGARVSSHSAIVGPKNTLDEHGMPRMDDLTTLGCTRRSAVVSLANRAEELIQSISSSMKPSIEKVLLLMFMDQIDLHHVRSVGCIKHRLYLDEAIDQFRIVAARGLDQRSLIIARSIIEIDALRATLTPVPPQIKQEEVEALFPELRLHAVLSQPLQDRSINFNLLTPTPPEALRNDLRIQIEHFANYVTLLLRHASGGFPALQKDHAYFAHYVWKHVRLANEFLERLFEHSRNLSPLRSEPVYRERQRELDKALSFYRRTLAICNFMVHDSITGFLNRHPSKYRNCSDISDELLVESRGVVRSTFRVVVHQAKEVLANREIEQCIPFVQFINASSDWRDDIIHTPKNPGVALMRIGLHSKDLEPIRKVFVWAKWLSPTSANQLDCLDRALLDLEKRYPTQKEEKAIKVEDAVVSLDPGFSQPIPYSTIDSYASTTNTANTFVGYEPSQVLGLQSLQGNLYQDFDLFPIPEYTL